VTRSKAYAMAYAKAYAIAYAIAVHPERITRPFAVTFAD